MKPRAQAVSLIHLLVLLFAFLLFLAFLMPQARKAPYYYDNYRHFSQVEEVVRNPQAAWLPDKDLRRHPAYFYYLVPQVLLFGPGPSPYYLVTFLFHFFVAFLITLLARSLGLGAGSALWAGLFFLCSSASYQTLITINGRPCLLFLFSGALLSWILFLRTGKAWAIGSVWGLQILSLLFAEEVVTFPLIGSLVTWKLVPERAKRNRLIFRHLLPIFLLSGVVLCFLLSSFLQSPVERVARVSFSALWLIPEKLRSLVEMLTRPLFVPEKGLLHENPSWDTVLRLAPLAGILGAGWFFLGRRGGIQRFFYEIPKRELLFSLAWVGIAVLPFLLQPLSFEHASRFLYFPLLGFAFTFGMVVDSLWRTSGTSGAWKGRIFLAVVLVYIFALNLNNTAYQFERYRRELQGRSEADYTEEVRTILTRARNPV